MSSSTALLPKSAKKDDHPIFLRVCHSPWISISQSLLVFGRVVIALYMAVVFSMVIVYEVKRSKHGWLMLFEFPNIVYLLQLIYALTGLSWTYMHLHYPHHRSLTPSYATRLQKFFSPPRQSQSTKNRVFFSIFYTAVVSFPHVITLVYWLILVPRKQENSQDLLSRDWFTQFVVFNKYAVNSAIALIEVLILNSIKRQEPIWGHIFGLTFLSLLYVGWAYIGKFVTGTYVYFFFDFNLIGWEHVIVAIGSFCALSNIFFAVVYGITGFREMLTKRSEEKSANYTRLPQ